MKRLHEMPFGAECLGGGVRFRLWAPAAAKVDLCLGDATLPMTRVERGWFQLTVADAGPGSRYKFRIHDGLAVPDPASRFQPEDVHGPSQVVRPDSFDWKDDSWPGRPWEEAVIYELHVGAFTPEGTFAAAEKKLDYLAELGVTAIQLMPISDFPGRRNWGYDGVLPYAPDSSYGTPEDLKRLIQAAHHRGLMVFLDVVYNHFGPEGNYLRSYAPQFFTDRHKTPWGDAVNFDGPGSRTVRDFFIHNALYWLEEYHFDGLRLDAVDQIKDESGKHILTEIAEAVRARLGERRVHLVLENDDNAARFLRRDAAGRPTLYNAQWADDIHHALHVLLTGESDGYYSDYAENPARHLGRGLAEGFIYQGEVSPYRNRPRGEVSRDLPPTAFVSFLQNHDQVGNRAFGERILDIAPPQALRAAAALLLLAPLPPLVFMGEEFGARTPFLFFCDFGGELAKAVTEGRRKEFARFARFRSPESRESIPDPEAEQTFLRSKLDWNGLRENDSASWLSLYRELLQVRQRVIVPLLSRIVAGAAEFSVFGRAGFRVDWKLQDGGALSVMANMSGEETTAGANPEGKILYSSSDLSHAPASGYLPPWSAAWFLHS